MLRALVEQEGMTITAPVAHMTTAAVEERLQVVDMVVATATIAEEQQTTAEERLDIHNINESVVNITTTVLLNIIYKVAKGFRLFD